MPYGMRRMLNEAYYRGTGRSAILRNVDRAERLQRASRDEVEAGMRRELAALLSHAAHTVPYYRDLTGGADVTPASALSVLEGMPILTKDVIRREGARLRSERPGRRTFWNTSGGSTGEPIRLLQDLEMQRASRTIELLLMRWAGHRRGEPHLLIWGVRQEALGEPVPVRERLFRFVNHEAYLDCYRITDGLLDRWMDVIDDIRPTLIEAYVDALYELSVRILKTGRRVTPPRGVITSAGVLTPLAEDAIRRAFGCPILNRYGSREVSNVACSCGTGRDLHVIEQWSYLEVVDREGRACPPGVEGDILVTLFGNRSMPLVRYRIEDRGVWATGPCACGRTSRRLASVMGRSNDFLVAEDGTRINGLILTGVTLLTRLMHAANGIRQFQCRQSQPGHVTLAVVPEPGADPVALRASLGEAVAGLKEVLRGMNVDVTLENEIAPSNSGKFRFVRNEIPG